VAGETTRDGAADRPVALVTGARVGLGKAVALALAEAGYCAAVADKDTVGLDDVARDCAARGPASHAVPLDVRDEDSIDACLSQVLGRFGRLDLLVNNAGVALHRPAASLTWSEWDTVLDVNLKGVFFMSQRFSAYLLRQERSGNIVNIASAHGIVALAERSAYGISKAGVIHLTKMLAIEWAGRGIRVNAVAPGTVMTPSRAEALKDPAALGRMLERIPTGRFPTAEEVAAAVVYLASPGAASVTGHTLVLDGGTTVC
jgi:NAD(P)-dependent dehydrogenase (short-subunit alcohol dehydrogenase family)